MHIEVQCFATLAPSTPPGGKLELPENSTVAYVLDQLGIPQEDVKIIFINGAHSSEEAALSDGDRLGLFPAVGGG